MSKIFKVLGYVVIISQIFSINVPILSFNIAGYTIKYILFYIFIILSIVKWFAQIITHMKIKKVDLFFVCFIFFPYFIGMIMGWNIQDIIEESILFIMPFAVYTWSESENLDKDKFIKIFFFTVILGAVVSVMVALRIIETDIWAANDQFVRAAGAVDSTLFLGGAIMSFIMLFVCSEKQNETSKLFATITFVSGIIGLLFSQSRSRIALFLMLIGCFLVFNLFYKKSKWGNVKILSFVCVSILVIWLWFPEIFAQIINQVQARFETLNDENIVFRQTESAVQIDAFLKSPLFGLGWGSRAQFQNMYVHNIYSTLLMQGGIIFFGCFIIWFFNFIKTILYDINKIGINCENIICLTFWGILFILGFSNAGFVLTGGYFMLLYIFLCDSKFNSIHYRRFSEK